MKVLVISLFVGAMGYAPVYAFDNLVLPQLNALQQTYQSAGQTAAAIAGDE